MDERAESMAAPNPQAADPYSLLVLNVRGTVTQIALESGFGSASHFSKAFRAELGMSPREYLRALKGE